MMRIILILFLIFNISFAKCMENEPQERADPFHVRVNREFFELNKTYKFNYDKIENGSLEEVNPFHLKYSTALEYFHTFINNNKANKFNFDRVCHILFKSDKEAFHNDILYEYYPKEVVNSYYQYRLSTYRKTMEWFIKRDYDIEDDISYFRLALHRHWLMIPPIYLNKEDFLSIIYTAAQRKYRFFFPYLSLQELIFLNFIRLKPQEKINNYETIKLPNQSGFTVSQDDIYNVWEDVSHVPIHYFSLPDYRLSTHNNQRDWKNAVDLEIRLLEDNLKDPGLFRGVYNWVTSGNWYGNQSSPLSAQDKAILDNAERYRGLLERASVSDFKTLDKELRKNRNTGFPFHHLLTISNQNELEQNKQTFSNRRADAANDYIKRQITYPYREFFELNKTYKFNYDKLKNGSLEEVNPFHLKYSTALEYFHTFININEVNKFNFDRVCHILFKSDKEAFHNDILYEYYPKEVVNSYYQYRLSTYRKIMEWFIKRDYDIEDDISYLRLALNRHWLSTPPIYLNKEDFLSIIYTAAQRKYRFFFPYLSLQELIFLNFIRLKPQEKINNYETIKLPNQSGFTVSQDDIYNVWEDVSHVPIHYFSLPDYRLSTHNKRLILISSSIFAFRYIVKGLKRFF